MRTRTGRSDATTTDELFQVPPPHPLPPSLLTQRSEAPSGAGVAAALATGVAAAALTHAGSGDAAPG